MAKFKVGDQVRLMSDPVTIYIVIGINEINGAFFYDLRGAMKLTDVPEKQIALV